MTEPPHSKRYNIKTATAADSNEMLQIYEEEAAPGNPSLIFTRRDNAFFSMQREGEVVKIFTCRHSESGVLVGFGAYSINTCFVNGTQRLVAYLFGLKCRREFRRSVGRMIREIYGQIKIELAAQGVDCVITTILSHNHPARQLLTRHHTGMPRYEPRGRYEVFAVQPRNLCRPSLPAKIECSSAHRFGLALVKNFLQSEGKRRNFFPVLTDTSALPTNFFNDCLVICEKNSTQILALGFCWDQTSYKQYIVARYHGVYKALRKVQPLLSCFGVPSLPAPGERLKISTLSFVLVRDERADAFSWLLIAAAQQCRSYDLMLIGTGPHHPHREQLRKHPHWVYSSDIYEVHWPVQGETVEPSAHTAVPTYLECGRL